MKRSGTHEYLLIAVVGAVAGVGPAFAQDNGKVMIDVADCIKLEAAEARLACYEARVAAVFGQRAAQAAAARPATPAASAPARPPEPAPAASSPPAAPARTVAATASPPAAEEIAPAPARAARQTRREEKAQEAEATAPSDIVSTIKELREVFPDAWQVTLENGQVWRQTFSKHFELRPGYHVRIYGTHWGNASRLAADEVKGYIQVERVR